MIFFFKSHILFIEYKERKHGKGTFKPRLLFEDTGQYKAEKKLHIIIQVQKYSLIYVYHFLLILSGMLILSFFNSKPNYDKFTI